MKELKGRYLSRDLGIDVRLLLKLNDGFKK
jgi:hypothetical protein